MRRGWVVGGVLAVVVVAALALVSTRLGSLVQREAVVAFSRTATPAQHRAARAACSGLPNIVTEPPPRNTLRASQLNDVRFRVEKADDAELARLFDCLRRQPGVIGVDIPGSQ